MSVRAEMEQEHAHEHGGANMTDQRQVEEEFKVIESSQEAAELGLEEVGNQFCPLSDQKIDFDDPKHKPARLAYKGKVYNFCCDMCVKDFKKDPEKFIRKIKVNEGT
jgi:YHS domain-containing protein